MKNTKKFIPLIVISILGLALALPKTVNAMMGCGLPDTNIGDIDVVKKDLISKDSHGGAIHEAYLEIIEILTGKKVHNIRSSYQIYDNMLRSTVGSEKSAVNSWRRQVFTSYSSEQDCLERLHDCILMYKQRQELQFAEDNAMLHARQELHRILYEKNTTPTRSSQQIYTDLLSKTTYEKSTVEFWGRIIRRLPNERDRLTKLHECIGRELTIRHDAASLKEQKKVQRIKKLSELRARLEYAHRMNDEEKIRRYVEEIDQVVQKDIQIDLSTSSNQILTRNLRDLAIVSGAYELSGKLYIKLRDIITKVENLHRATTEEIVIYAYTKMRELNIKAVRIKVGEAWKILYKDPRGKIKIADILDVISTINRNPDMCPRQKTQLLSDATSKEANRFNLGVPHGYEIQNVISQTEVLEDIGDSRHDDGKPIDLIGRAYIIELCKNRDCPVEQSPHAHQREEEDVVRLLDKLLDS